MGGGEGGEGGINGKNKIEEKISEGNNLNIPLKPNLNSKIVEFGKLRDSRKARWLGRGLTVNVNEFGKRRASWDGVKGGKQVGKWVASNNAHNTIVGLGPPKQKAQALLGSKKPILGLDLSSSLNFKAGKSSFSGLNALEPSYQNGISIPSSSRSELTATKELESSMVSPTTSEQLAMLPEVILDTISSLAVTEVAGDGDQHSPPQLVQPPTVPIGPAVVAQAFHKPLSAISAPSGSRLV